MKDFIKRHLLSIIGPWSYLLVFLVLFLLFQLDLRVFLVGMYLCIVFQLFSLLYLFLFDSKGVKSDEALQKENAELKSMVEAAYRRQSDLEEYFLLWVHQIKTPITAGNLLLEESQNPDVSELKNQFLKIENYSSMAMNYIKISNPEKDMDFDTVSLHSIILPLIQKYSIQFISNKISLHYQSIDQKVLSDPKLLGILIEQLLSNALKYTENGNVRIEFDAEQSALKIIDDGPGISADQLPKIFDKGYSGFNGRLEQKSSGLGLYLAKEIANRLNHEIEVASEPGQGSCFSVRFKKESS